jgi:AraC-like DNA-binding protein
MKKPQFIVPTVGTSPIQSILLVKLIRHVASHVFEATSLPGHLIHLVLRGRVHQECNGREYDLRPGTVIWYHEDELVRGHVLKGPWHFYSINFIAPSLPPPNFESRLFFPSKQIRKPFTEIFKAWNDTSQAPSIRGFRVHASLLQILASLTRFEQKSQHMDPRARLWWELETELRKDLRQRMTLRSMEQVVKRSQATIARSCQYAVGMPPLKRIKRVRMSLAKGLVKSSDLTITEIADRVGYERVHDFSRDYHKYHNLTPTQDRRKVLDRNPSIEKSP